MASAINRRLDRSRTIHDYNYEDAYAAGEARYRAGKSDYRNYHSDAPRYGEHRRVGSDHGKPGQK